jgi:uncharacterized protein YndB with AHSA1/START domain
LSDNLKVREGIALHERGALVENRSKKGSGMTDIVHRLNINAPGAKVFQAVSTVDGLKGWWTNHVDGVSQEGKQLTFRFPDQGPVMEVLELIPDEFIKWKCVDGVDAWKDTILTFEMEDLDGGTDLFFAQSGWEEQTGFFAQCNTKWALYLLSLKEFCEQGQGHPFPKDIQIEKKQKD